MLQAGEMVRAAGVPLAAVWLQDWVGKRRTTAGDRLWWNWVLDDHPEAGSYASWDALRALGSEGGTAAATAQQKRLAPQLPGHC